MVNHAEVPINSNDHSVYGRFLPAEQATVQTALLDGGTPGGTINFADPWLIDATDRYGTPTNRGMSAALKNRASPFTIDLTTSYGGDVYKGVLLNQDLTFDPTLPYYTVSAPAPQTINGFSSFFLNWGGTNVTYQNSGSAQTGVVFTNSGATATANYKAHLASFSSTATAANNQRKIAQAENGTYCIVYTSSDRIWFCTGTDGYNWSNETEISEGSSGSVNSYPSIAIRNNIAYIVWQSMAWYGDPSSLCYIQERSYNLATQAWSSTDEVSEFTPDIQNFLATPAIGVAYYDVSGPPWQITDIIVVWREPSQLSIMEKSTDQNYWHNKSAIVGTNNNSNCYFPSIACSGHNSYAPIAWQDISNASIKYIEAHSYGYGWSWYYGNPVQLSPSGWGSNAHPSVAISNDNASGMAIVAWESLGNLAEGMPSVHVRRKTGLANAGSWESTITSFTMSSAGSLQPSIGTRSSSYEMMLIWNLGNNVYSAQFDGGSWGSLYLLASGALGGTGLNVTAPYSTNIAGTWKESDGHLLARARLDRGLGKTATADSINLSIALKPIPLAYHINRHSLIELQSLPELNDLNVKGLIGFEVARFDKDSTTPIGFFDDDTLFSQDSTVAQHSTLQSNKFTAQNNTDKLTLAGAYYAKGLNLPKKTSLSDIEQQIAQGDLREGSDLAVVTLKDNTTSMKEIWRVPFSHLTNAAGGTDGEYRKIPVSLNGLAGKELRLDISMIGSQEGIQPIIVNDYLILSDQDQQMEQLSKSAPRVISSYALYQNYPNPFNPTTVISYQLPMDGNVTLKIYDVLGREIAVLVDGFKSAGYYSAEWDACKMSSGIYFYHLSVQSQNSKSLFTDTKRMVVMK